MITKERVQTTNVKIPKMWKKTNDGRFKVNVPYKRNYGTVNPESIPSYVVTIGCRPNCIVLYADRPPIIPNGACLTFTSK